MRNHKSLKVFALADRLALLVYERTRLFPVHERYGLSAQVRRAAVSVAANIVEGAARSSDKEFARMLMIAYGSARELEYEMSLASRLGYLSKEDALEIEDACIQTSKALRALIAAVTSGARMR